MPSAALNPVGVFGALFHEHADDLRVGRTFTEDFYELDRLLRVQIRPYTASRNLGIPASVGIFLQEQYLRARVMGRDGRSRAGASVTYDNDVRLVIPHDNPRLLS